MNIFSWHGSWKGFERLSLPNHSSTQAPMSHRTLSKVALSLSLITCLTSSTLRTAAVYVTTSLYDFHERQAGLLEVAGNAGIQADIQESMWDEVAPLMFLSISIPTFPGLPSPWPALLSTHPSSHVWVLPWPGGSSAQVQHRDIVLGALCAWGGRPLWHHWKAAHAVHHPVLPKTYQEVQSPEICRQGWYHKSFKWNTGKQQVLIPSICCLHKSTALEELYLEKADSAAITTYLLAHTLKHLNNLRVLALPKQCDDDVASIIGISRTT